MNSPIPFIKQKALLSNWGNYPTVQADVLLSADYGTIADYVKMHKGCIARGNGRCYGDASLAKQVISTLQLNRLIEFDTENSILTCQSGVLLAEILDVIVPKGFFLPVLPGTKYITVGGAVAADVHGKNHHADGSFSRYVSELKVLVSDGTILRCSPVLNSDLFWKTCGGMGLTGVILEVKMQLKRIVSPYIVRRSIKTNHLDDTLQLLEKYQRYTYSVAWIDCFADRKNLGRGILHLGEHDTEEKLLRYRSRKPVSVPFYFPSFTINNWNIRIFNELYYHTQKQESTQKVAFEKFFFPLDGIQHWNRLYGKNGFVQYQFVMPKNQTNALRRVLETITRSGQGSLLSVLKAFGKSEPQHFMSFPEEGWTLALDFKVSEKIFRLLDDLDIIVREAGGKLYLAKDARMSKEMFQATYKRYLPGIILSLYSQNDLHPEMKKTILVLGANSDIAKATLKLFAKNGFDIILCARNTGQLHTLKSELEQAFGSRITLETFDAIDFATHEEFALRLHTNPDVVLCAFGYLGKQAHAEKEFREAKLILDTNFTGAVSVVQALLPKLKSGATIIGISSVAGDRGRESNYFYGSAKAALSTYLNGLRHQLFAQNIHVMLVKPGFVRTRMVQGKKIPKLLLAAPETVARDIYNGYKRKRNIIYSPWYWRWVMVLIKAIPEFVFKRLSL